MLALSDPPAGGESKGEQENFYCELENNLRSIIIAIPSQLL